MSEYTEADELNALRYLVARLVAGVQGEPVTVLRGSQAKRTFYRAEHDVELVERARRHIEGRKDKSLLVRLEAAEKVLERFARHCPDSEWGDVPDDRILMFIDDERLIVGDVRAARRVLRGDDEQAC